jgi:hypothetical protein
VSLVLIARIAALAPGVIVHEFGHWLLCRLSGVRVRQVVLFRVGTPAGYVTHAAPRLLRQQLAIAAGPLAVSTLLAATIFVILGRLLFTRPESWWPAAACVLAWLGCSIALEAWPSAADAGALRRLAAQHVRQLNLGAALVLPVSWAIGLLSATRRFGGHWAYTGLLAFVSFRLAAG